METSVWRVETCARGLCRRNATMHGSTGTRAARAPALLNDNRDDGLELFSYLSSFRLQAEFRRLEVPPEGGNYTKGENALTVGLRCGAICGPPAGRRRAFHEGQ